VWQPLQRFPVPLIKRLKRFRLWYGPAFLLRRSCLRVSFDSWIPTKGLAACTFLNDKVWFWLLVFSESNIPSSILRLFTMIIFLLFLNLLNWTDHFEGSWFRDCIPSSPFFIKTDDWCDEPRFLKILRATSSLEKKKSLSWHFTSHSSVSVTHSYYSSIQTKSRFGFPCLPSPFQLILLLQPPFICFLILFIFFIFFLPSPCPPTGEQFPDHSFPF